MNLPFASSASSVTCLVEGARSFRVNIENELRFLLASPNPDMANSMRVAGDRIGNAVMEGMTNGAGMGRSP
jgi:hypothetical protein